jgi:hypothetical protein
MLHVITGVGKPSVADAAQLICDVFDPRYAMPIQANRVVNVQEVIVADEARRANLVRLTCAD